MQKAILDIERKAVVKLRRAMKSEDLTSSEI